MVTRHFGNFENQGHMTTFTAKAYELVETSPSTIIKFLSFCCRQFAGEHRSIINLFQPRRLSVRKESNFLGSSLHWYTVCWGSAFTRQADRRRRTGRRQVGKSSRVSCFNELDTNCYIPSTNCWRWIWKIPVRCADSCTTREVSQDATPTIGIDGSAARHRKRTDGNSIMVIP